ncbi:MAG: phosphoglucosamine mutase [Candidatus Rokuibacteriota bacterium]
MTRLFGTDGIRGVANEEPLTPELAFRVGRQLVATLQVEHGADRVRLVIGRDPRRSGPLLESALVAGLLSAGGDCYAVGVLPTPAIAYLTRKLQAHGGIVLSASHNPFEDNGIKLFSSEGTKFPDAWEDEIERRLGASDSAPRAHGARIGELIVYDRAESDYVEFLCRSFPLDLGGLTLALDCAHGATYRVAPRVFRRLGARVLAIGARPNGRNINAGVGALHPEALQRKVRASGASAGFAFDGDGDRLISVDGAGEIRDGDYALAIAGRHFAARGRLKGNLIVTTVMANLGLDQVFRAAGIRVVKTQVGDRYVYEEMQKLGASVGGEQSGHLLFLDHAPAGDGILSALVLLSVASETGETLGSLAGCLTKCPQVLLNVSVKSKPPIESLAGLAGRAAEFEREMNGNGRILIRYSGTEPLARVMIEGADGARIREMAEELAGLIRARIGA